MDSTFTFTFPRPGVFHLTYYIYFSSFFLVHHAFFRSHFRPSLRGFLHSCGYVSCSLVSLRLTFAVQFRSNVARLPAQARTPHSSALISRARGSSSKKSILCTHLSPVFDVRPSDHSFFSTGVVDATPLFAAQLAIVNATATSNKLGSASLFPTLASGANAPPDNAVDLIKSALTDAQTQIALITA